jgi:hypothetical protein
MGSTIRIITIKIHIMINYNSTLENKF